MPIQTKLVSVILLTSGAVLMFTCSSFLAYEFVTFRHASVRQLEVMGEIIAANSTASLAFDDQKDAQEILGALRAEKHIAEARLYDKGGNFFASYPPNQQGDHLPATISDHYEFGDSYITGFQPVMLDGERIGTLYLKSDMVALYDRLKLYAVILGCVILLSAFLAYALSKSFQREIAGPILQLAKIARKVSDEQDYSVRASKNSEDELGALTDAFNHMLMRIQNQTVEIKSFNQKLEEVVVQRTNELKAANKELESFSYSVSHDLRAPLRSINGYMNIFLEEYSGQFDGEAKRLMNIILNNAKRMGALIDDLLEFSKINRSEITKGQIFMRPLVLSICDELKIAESMRNIEFMVHELPDAYGDFATVRQVWTNLISNAIKYTRHKDPAKIEIGSQFKDDATVYFVRDNGAGFDMRYYEKLFGVFQRLHSQQEFDGTGVGLAIVDRIISKHGGKIWASGKVNEGAVFYFTLQHALEIAVKE